MKAGAIATFVLAFAIAFVLVYALVHLALPPIHSWHAESCIDSVSFLCNLSRHVLNWWWAAVLPSMVLLVIAMHKAYVAFRRN